MKKAIAVTNLSKRFQLGLLHHNDLMQERLLTWIKSPFKNCPKSSPNDEFWALRNISFNIRQGEVTGIIGRNGAGKSTLLKLISKIIHPTSGKIEVQGRLASLLEVGTGFHGELTGRENIFLNGSILGMKKKEIENKLDAIVSFAGVETFIDTPVKRYSSGMYLRLGFAVSAHLEPDVLLVDEVLAVGDAAFQRKCLDTMDGLRSGGRTVLFVSHNMAAVENLCSRALWIDNGEIRQDGDAREVIASYMASFAGDSTMGRDLRNVESRRGNGSARYTKIEFRDAGAQPLRVFRTGDQLNVRLHYQANEEIIAPNFELGVSTNLGTLLTRFSTYIDFEISSLKPGEGYIDLRTEPLNLIPQRYYISLWLKSQGPTYYDILEQCAQLEVVTSDFYGAGKGLERYYGVLLVPGKWTLNGSVEGRPWSKGDNCLVKEA